MLFKTFGAYLGYIIDARMPLTEFRAAVGISESFLSNILCDRKTIPLKRIDQFAAALLDETKDRERFCLAAELTHASPRVRKALLTLSPEVMAAPVSMANPAAKRKRTKWRTAQKKSPKPRASH